MSNEQVKQMFESMVAAQPDKDKQDVIKLVMLYFTDSKAREMISDMVWEQSQKLVKSN